MENWPVIVSARGAHSAKSFEIDTTKDTSLHPQSVRTRKSFNLWRAGDHRKPPLAPAIVLNKYSFCDADMLLRSWLLSFENRNLRDAPTAAILGLK